MANKTGLYNKRVIGIKTETTKGTKVTLAGTDCVINAFNASLNKDIAMTPRRSQVSMSNIKAIPGARGGSLSFETDLQGDGSGAALPALHDIFTHAGLKKAEESDVYTPTSDPALMKTATVGLWQSDLFEEELAGSMCNINMTFNAGQVAVLNVEYQGSYVGPSGVAIPSITFPDADPAMSIEAAASYNSVVSPTLMIANIGFNLQNSVNPRQDVSSEHGYHSFMVTDRNPQITFTAEARELSDVNWMAEWLASSERAFSFVVKTSDDSITFAFPKLQVTACETTEVNGITNFNITAQCNQTAGDDEFSITFAALE